MGRDKYSLFGPCKVQLEDEVAKIEINAASAGNLGSFLEGNTSAFSKANLHLKLRYMPNFSGTRQTITELQ